MHRYLNRSLFFVLLGYGYSFPMKVADLNEQRKRIEDDLARTVKAQLDRGLLCIKEEGNFVAARKYFEEVYNQQFATSVAAQACIQLAKLYYFGRGVSENRQKAYAYVQKAHDIIREDSKLSFIGQVQKVLMSQKSWTTEIKFMVDIFKKAQESKDRLSKEYLGMKLHEASNEECIEGITLLLEMGADINFCDKNGLKPLNSACSKGKREAVQFLLNKGAIWLPFHTAIVQNDAKLIGEYCAYQEDFLKVDTIGMTPLHVALWCGNFKLAQELVEKGSPVNASQNNGWTPLHWASFHGCAYLVKLLLSRGAEVNMMDSTKRTPLHYAAMSDDIAVARSLIDGGADVHAKNENGETSLHNASEKGHVNLVTLLIQRKVDINAWVSLGDLKMTALHLASYNGHEKVVECLIAQGALLNVSSKLATTPFNYALANGHECVVHTFLRLGVDVNYTDAYAIPPLHTAVIANNKKCVQLLLQHKAVVDSCVRKNGLTALHMAAMYGYRDIAHCLIDGGASIDAADNDGWTPLHMACRYGYFEIAKLLLDHGADHGLYTKQDGLPVKLNIGVTPLHCAAREGHGQLVRLLFSRGAFIEADTKTTKDSMWTGTHARTALHVAADNGQLEVVQILISCKAAVNVVDSAGATPLHLASLKGAKDIVRLLLKNGALVNISDRRGCRALHYAASEGHKEICEMLLMDRDGEFEGSSIGSFLAKGIRYAQTMFRYYFSAFTENLNAQNTDLETALHVASKKGHLDVVSYFVSLGADRSLLNAQGKTALQVGATQEIKKILDT